MSTAFPRILVVNNTTLLSAGTTRSLVLILKYLHHKYDFSVAAPTHSDGLPELLSGMGIRFHRLGSGRFDLPRSVFCLLGKRQYDLVYANNHEDEARWAFWGAKLKGIPFVWHVREHIGSRRRAWTLRFSDAVIANSQATADALVSRAGVRSPVVVPNGVEPSEFDGDRALDRRAVLRELRLRADPTVILNLGTLCSGKNQLDAVEVASRVVGKYPEARFLCMGRSSLSDVAYAGRVMTRVKERKLLDIVHLPGPRTDVVPYLVSADMLLHTAVLESQGRAVLEAMAARLPVVAYRVGGVPESVVDGETGFLVPPGDIGAAVEAICRLMADPVLRSKMGEAGRRRVLQRFTAEEAARKVEGVIQSVLARRVQLGTKGALS